MSSEPSEAHDRRGQDEAKKPNVDGPPDVSARGEVVPLEALRRNDLERGGGKGANLGELLAAGMLVPPGFCVTTAAYRNTLAAAGLDAAIDEALRNVRAEDPTSYEAVGAPPAAVRSSATTEDLPGASFAGQQVTSLNVRGKDELLDAVRRCWGSLWSARAIAYRQRQGFRHDQVG